jgi:hypothetical protein
MEVDPARQRVLAGEFMITEIDIDNFKSFEKIAIRDCKRVNAIVGDNGVGKTAFSPSRVRARSGPPPSASG